MAYEIDADTYELLYARYIDDSKTEEMVRLANPNGKSVLDLCCGNGRLSRIALKYYPSIVYAIDESSSMLLNWEMLNRREHDAINSTFDRSGRISLSWKNKGIKWGCLTVDTVLRSCFFKPVDIIFCQQAVNYWFHPDKVPLIKKKLSRNGVFVFNTFHNKPSIIPATRTYKLLNDLHYLEVSWLVGDKVKHVQVCEGMEPHVTEFRWIPPSEFRDSFKRYGFKVTVKKSGGSDLYICRKCP